ERHEHPTLQPRRHLAMYTPRDGGASHGAERPVEPGERLTLELRHALVVGVDRETGADEERDDAAAEELPVGDRPVRVPKCAATLGRQDAPVEGEIDAWIVAAEIDPVDHRARPA